MAQIIEMPKLSDTMEEGAIASWLKSEGEFIEEGEAFVEIETDKATMEYNSPEEGYLLKILVQGGQSCDLSAPICVVGEKGESFDLEALLGASAKQKPKAEAAAEQMGTAQATPAAIPQSGVSSAAAGRIKASPLAKKLAQEQGVDLSQIVGSGPGGRIVQKDIEGSGAGAIAAHAPTANTAALSANYQAVGQSAPQDIPNSMMRKTIAKRLLAGKNEAPHFYLKRSVNMTNLIQWRSLMNQQGAQGDTAPLKVSINDLIVQACAKALMKHPDVNSSWQGDFIRRFASADIAVAVAIPEGLITPVVRHAHLLGARDIARATKDLVGRAKAGNLRPEEYQGGTFSISNLGMMGIEEFTAIINPPQAAILAVGATIQTPWVDGNDGKIQVQPRMTLTMSCDHRVVDGAVGASFLQTLCNYIENPAMMLA